MAPLSKGRQVPLERSLVFLGSLWALRAIVSLAVVFCLHEQWQLRSPEVQHWNALEVISNGIALFFMGVSLLLGVGAAISVFNRSI